LAIKQVKIDVNEVTIGMFISGLDRPWAQTPFPIQGFYVRDVGEIKEIRGHCNHVYIDVVKGFASVSDVLEQLDNDVMAPVHDTKRAAGEMVDSVLRNPDAFTWLSRIQEADEFTYAHSLRCSVWAILFGRHIGLDKRELDVLGCVGGRIAGIVTFYDEVTHPRHALHPIAPSRAVSRLYEVRGSEFQEDLVVEFIRAIGLYPTGTLVELTTGEVALVVEQNFEKRLKPKVLVILDSLKDELPKYQLLDLAEDDSKKQALIDTGKRTPIEVEKIIWFSVAVQYSHPF